MKGFFYNKFNILNEIEFTDWAPRDLLLWIQSSTVQSRSISYSCLMRSVYVQFRKIWFGSRNISIFTLQYHVLRTYFEIALIAKKTATWMNFNTVIAVAIDMSVKYAKVQANWFLKPLPQLLQVLPTRLIHRDRRIRKIIVFRIQIVYSVVNSLFLKVLI